MLGSDGSGTSGNSSSESLSGPQLSAEVYAQLKQIAYGRLGSLRPGITLNCTALVHEAFLKLQPVIKNLDGGSEGQHFMALASMAMRQIIVDYVRQRMAGKRGGDVVHVTLQESQVPGKEDEFDLLELDDAMRRLSVHDPDLEQIVVMRFFGGFNMTEIAKIHGRSKRSLERDWTRARIYLFRELKRGHD